MPDYVYELENVTLFYKNLRSFSILGKMVNRNYHEVPTKFIALDDISFKIERGKSVGVIGRNGSGKTTLIRLLAGVYSPDHGTIKANSKSISMLALGVGFDSAASGYDNIYLNSLLRGYSKKEVDEKVEEIIEFSGIRKFIYNPVKTYSTGMKMRLAFSTAVHFQPDVLLLDEAMSVGDAEFQRKSAEKMRELIRESTRTVIIVTHSLSLVQQECDQVIWLDSGKVRMIGPTEEVLKVYKETSG
jgi:ABC-type polysaccharide/polyol phosphate transport system ATPase subunit